MPKKRPNRNRMMIEPRGTRRLWDEAGREWQPQYVDIPKDQVLEMVRDPSVKMGIYRFASELVWVPAVQKERVWREEIQPNFDVEAKVAWKARGQLPYVATLWRSGDDALLMFDDFD